MQEKNTTNTPTVNATPGSGLESAAADRLDKAAADRLTALLIVHQPGKPDMHRLLRKMNRQHTPQERFLTLELCAGVILALDGKPRRRARMQALFNGLNTPPLTPEARADCNRAGRACRLLRRLLLTGCQKRGEG